MYNSKDLTKKKQIMQQGETKLREEKRKKVNNGFIDSKGSRGFFIKSESTWKKVL